VKFNPLRSEGEAFRLVVYALIAAVVFVAIVLIARALF
jgi:hypothetical protein